MARSPAFRFWAWVQRSAFGSFFHYLKIFTSEAGYEICWLFAVSFVSSVLEGLGIAMFLPLFQIGASASAEPGTSRIEILLSKIHWHPTFSEILLALLCIFSLKGILKYAELELRGQVIANFISRLRIRIINRLFNLRYQSFTEQSRGHLINIVTTEVQAVGNTLAVFIQGLVSLGTMIAYVILSLTLDFKLTLLGFAAAALFGNMLRALSSQSAQVSADTSLNGSLLSSALHQTLGTFKYLKATGSGRHLHARLQQLTSQASGFTRKSNRLAGIQQGLQQPITILVFITIIVFAVKVQGSSVTSVFLVLGMIYKFTMSLNGFLKEWQAFRGTSGSVDATFASQAELLAGAERPTLGKDPIFSKSIEFRNVSFAVDQRTILNPFNLSIAKNSILGIMGHSGAGKTTLTDLLTGLLRPTQGEVYVDNCALGDLSLEAWKLKIGFVTQDCFVFNDTILNNVTLWQGDPADPILREQVRRVLNIASALSFIDELPQGVDTRIGDAGIQLSGGQRQRITIARELFREPELLVMDEATSALDSETESVLQQSLATLKGKLTVVIISHRLACMSLCDHIAVMDNGSVVEHGPFAVLFADPTSQLRRMAKGQSLGNRDASPRLVLGEIDPVRFSLQSQISVPAPDIIDISETGVSFRAGPTTENLQVGDVLNGDVGIGEWQGPITLKVIHRNAQRIGCAYIDDFTEAQHRLRAFILRKDSRKVA